MESKNDDKAETFPNFCNSDPFPTCVINRFTLLLPAQVHISPNGNDKLKM